VRMGKPMHLLWSRSCKDLRSTGRVLRRLLYEDNGQDLVEYGLLLLLVALVCIGSMQVVAGAVLNVFNNASSNITSAAS